MRIKRMQLTARSFCSAPARAGGHSSFWLAGRLRGGPPGRVRWVHGGRQLMRQRCAAPERPAVLGLVESASGIKYDTG